MKNYGDITKISGCDVPPVNVIIGGSPCQDLSIAGKRSGLSGERSGLFMEQIRIIKEMRNKDARAGRTDELIRPRFMVWENVPGAFSSNKAEDFRIVLEETAKIADPDAVIPRPPKGKWTTVGCIVGDGWSIAWRVLDTQFWGVPQRRRRIALVADFGGSTAPEILFERKGVPGDIEPCTEKRKRIAEAAEMGVRVSNRKYKVALLNDQGGSSISGSDNAAVAPTLRAETHGNIPTVLAYCIQGNCIDRADTAGCNGRGWTEDISYTLNTIDRHAVVYDARGNGDGSIVPTLTGDHESRITDYTAIAIDRAAFNQGVNAKYDIGISEEDIAYTVVAKGPGAVCIGNGQADQLKLSDKVGALNCMHDQHAVINFNSQLSIVRRLTPLECERLQGYPDGWTDIGEWIDSKGRMRKSVDTLRYKALGNSIALPPWTYVLSKLSAYCNGDHTMASLFDGIGGFPLIWERLRGKGHCLWVSEIDDFPSAVTNRRFEEE